MSSDFSQNLRFLCAGSRSIAAVCREIGMNRQQFNRYLNERGLPSAHNLRRIAQHFSLSEADLFTPHGRFKTMLRDRASGTPSTQLDFFTPFFKDQARHLRQYIGCYHGYFRTPTWPGRIVRTLIWLRSVDGYVATHTFERATASDGSIRQHGRYQGMTTLRNNRICMYETSKRGSGFLSETVLVPAHPQQISYLEGLTLGVSARQDLQPFSTRTVWVRIPTRVSAREALSATGAFPENSPRLDPKARRLLGSEPPLSLSPKAAEQEL